jgi:MarR family multiple gene transcriptional regulator MgrA
MSDANKNVRLLYQLGNSLVKLRNRKAEAFGLTSVQMDVVAFLLKNRIRMKSTSLMCKNILALSHPAVTGIIRRTEEKGFLRREQSSRDARYNCLHLTEKALELEDVLDHDAAEVEKIVMKNMSAAEQEEFHRLLLLAMDNIRSTE